MAREDEDRRIIRHEEAAEPTFSGGDADLIEAIDDHVTEHFGAPANVFHELVSPYVHVDVHVVEPTDERPVYTLVTSGMAERPMQTPVGERYAELMLLLPPDWPDVKSSGAPEEALWPFRLLQTLAQLPHEFETFLDAGHTVPNGDALLDALDDAKVSEVLQPDRPSAIRHRRVLFRRRSRRGVGSSASD